MKISQVILLIDAVQGTYVQTKVLAIEQKIAL